MILFSIRILLLGACWLTVQRMTTNWATANAVLYHCNGTLPVNLVWAWQDLATAERILQANAALIVSWIWSTLVFSLKPFVKANVAHVTMKGSVLVNPTNATFCAMVGMFIFTSEVFTDWAKVCRHFRVTSGTSLSVSVDLYSNIWENNSYC